MQDSKVQFQSGLSNVNNFICFKTELAEQRKLTEDYRTQLLALETEMDYMRDQCNASKEVLKVYH